MNYILQVIKSQRIRTSLSLINVLGLSVCVAAALLMLLYVRFELSYDSFHDVERVFRVESRLYEGETLTDNWATTAFGHAPVMKREIPGIETYVRLTAQDRELAVRYGDRQFTESGYCYAEPSFFEIFNFPVVRGDKNGQLVRPQTVVVTESAARRYFGDSDPLGKILTFRTATSEQNFEVTGVIGDMPVNSHIRYDFLLSYSTIPKERQDIWYIHGVYTYVRLDRGSQPEEIEDGFRAISDKYRTTALKHKTWKIELVPLKDIHLTPQKSYEKEAKGNRSAVYLLAAMALALLVIGWVNALNLMVARYLERGKELGVRKVFGATRRQLLLMGLTEAGMMNLLAILLSFGWLEVLIPAVYSWIGLNPGIRIVTDPQFWGMVAVIFLVGVLFIGLYPSCLQKSVSTADVLHGRLLHSRKGNMMRKMLIVVQFAASFVLITGTFVVTKQAEYMQQESFSPDMRQILVIKYPSFSDDMAVRIENFRKQLKQKSYVRQVTVSGAVPGVEVANYFTNRKWGSDPSEIKLMQMFSVDNEYIDTYFPGLVCGRGFSEKYGSDLNNVVLNEEAVRMLGFGSNEEALGKQLKMEVLNEPLEIIGVVGNYHQQSLMSPYKPIIFFISERVPMITTPYISVRMDGKADSRRLEEIEQVYRAYFSDSLFSYFFLDDFNDGLYKVERNFGWIFGSAALLAVLVACLGLWVVMLFSALARTREIAIRKILGAGRMSLFMVLTREFLWLTFLAALIGVPVSVFFMNSWLEGYAFRISLSCGYYAVAFVLMMFIAFITVFGRVWYVIRQKPMRVLRNE